MKNVLFVVDEKRMGGVSVLLSDILNNINLTKYNVDVMVLHNNGDCLDDLPSEVNLIYGSSFFDVVDLSFNEVLKTKKIDKIFKKAYLVFLMKTGLIKRKIINERKKCVHKKYDVEVAFKDGFTALFTAYGDSKYKYHWLHTDYSMYDCTAKYKKVFDETFKKFNKIIGISNSVVQKFQSKYPNTECKVIYNLINVDKIINMSDNSSVEFSDGVINLVSVGRIHNMKGYDRLVKVFNQLNENGKLDNVYLRIIGDGPDFNMVKDLIKEYNLENKIELLGSVKNPFPYVKSSDAFLMCSRYEPFGLVILESMVLGTPVISTEVASIHEIMNDDLGIITDNSEQGLYLAISSILEDKNKLKKYKQNLQSYNYDTASIINDIEKLLDEV